MITLSDGSSVHLIGDPHLGKAFEVGVSLARRGEREKSQMADFKKELAVSAHIIVMVGDLFDHPYVSYSVVGAAEKAVKEAVLARPNVTFVMMAGNHDMPRNITAVGAFDDFKARLDGRYPNLHILTKPRLIGKVAFFPWEWNRRADDQVDDIKGAFELAVGHWDLSLFEGKDTHLAPVARLGQHVEIWSGHYHKPGRYTVRGREVDCTGSLQPYSHSEDPSETRYVTLTRADALARTDLKDKCVRVILSPGEDLPEIDALQLTHIRSKPLVDEGLGQSVSLDTFDWQAILNAKLSPLDPAVRTFINERLATSQ
jgi:DNA repair exonuclease SbcCD nuclease subunit